MQQESGIYTWWDSFRKGEATGQVATLITLVIAVIFLFVVVSMNIGRIAVKKTVTANAADGASMKLASIVGSYANLLSIRYVDGEDEQCERSYGIIFLAIAILITVLTWGAAVETIGLALAAASAAAGIGFAAYNAFEVPGQIVDRIQRQLRSLSTENNFKEQAIMYALFNSVDDPAEVVDEHDYDEDMDTTDMIPRFAYWYAERVRAMTDLAVGVSEELEATIEAFLPILEEFLGEADAFRTSFTEDETRALYGWDPEAGEEVISYPDADGEFVVLLEELSELDIEASFWVQDADTEANHDEVDSLSAALYNFYDFGSAFIGQDFDNIVAARDYWRELLYNEDPEFEGETWYETWNTQIANIDGWLVELPDLAAEVEELIAAEVNPEQLEYLTPLRERIDEATERLTEFQQTISDFYQEILNFYNASMGEEQEAEDENYEPEATYSWHDSLGWHHLHVEVDDFVMPYVDIDRDTHWYGDEICVSLRPPSATVTVRVDRYDQSTAHSFFSGGEGQIPWWRFRYTDSPNLADAPDEVATGGFDPSNPDQALVYGIQTESTARWYYNQLPQIVQVR